MAPVTESCRKPPSWPYEARVHPNGARGRSIALSPRRAGKLATSRLVIRGALQACRRNGRAVPPPLGAGRAVPADV